MGLERNGQHTSRIFCLLPGQFIGGVGCIPENRSVRQSRYYLLEYFQRFRAEFRIEDRKSGKIAARASQAGDKTGAHRINGCWMDDRDGRSRFFGSLGCRSGDDYDDVE